MFTSKSHFDYEAILEACELQDENLKTAIQEKGRIETDFYEQLETLKKLNVERDEQHEILMDVTNNHKKKLLQLEKLNEKMSILNAEQKKIQEEIANLQQELENESEDFVETIVEMDGQLEELYLQFEDETLLRQMNEVDEELEYSQNLEDQLQRKVWELRNSELDLSEYDRPTILKTIIDELPATDVDEIETQLVEKRKNIEYLQIDYEKNLQMLEEYN